MMIVGFVGFAGVVVFGLLYIVFFFKGFSLKIPAIGMAVFGLALAAAVILTQMGITLPGNSTADEPPESASADGELSGFTPAPGLTAEPAPPSAPATAEEFERILIGKWSNAYRTDDRINTYRYDFSVEGYFEVGGNIYDNTHNYYDPEIMAEPEDEYGWYQNYMNVGILGDSGNYSLTDLGNNRFALEMLFFSDAYGDWYTRELTYVDDNTILIDGETYVRGSDYTLAEYARIFGFDLEVEDAVDNPAEKFERILTGSWSSARRNNDMIYTTGFDFSSGGGLYIWTGAYSNIHSDINNPYREEDSLLEDNECDEYGWYIAPMGHPSFEGRYSLTVSGGGRVALEAVGDWTDAGPVASAYELAYVDDNTVLIDGETYVRGGDYTLAQYAKIFGFDIEV